MSNNILLLEDDPLFGETLVDMLEDEDFNVSLYPNGQAALDATFTEKFDLYVLDINVPLIDGVTLLKELREAEDETPAIFVTSHKEKEMMQKGFLNGGDDYIVKPFDNDELILRVNALLRRFKQKEKVCKCGLCIDNTRKVISYNSEELELSKREFEVLSLLIKHANSVVSKEMILDELYNLSQSGSEGAIRVYINRIKQLLPEHNLENVRGIGYKLVC
ncbi:response regulator transcription factor [Sulfurimonas marina]|uniref:Response regulator transcription factor n=1 Tax=Sulfurimonas marina TaxID=2590551 RepID=A0A7M1AW79_9BACT|nr:response regulator transcription factor [Sulfurimonas marina]QOP41709.1 response regulator transcription factor [Sulfurimonas marina]